MKLSLFAVVLVLFFATGIITLLGIVQRVKIEHKYLNKLFSVLILELAAAVIYLFGTTSFFSESALSAEQQARLSLLETQFPGQSTDDLQAQFSSFLTVEARFDELEASLSQTNQTLLNLESENKNLNQQLIAKQDQIQWLTNELELRKADTIRLLRLEKLFLVRMAELSSKISEWGSSVNLLWKSDEKRDIALLLQEAFKEIGFMNELEIPNDDPLLAHDILIRYQDVKNFKERGFLTQQTVALIIEDHLNSANSHIR